MFALKKNKTEFCGRPLRIFPSSENPQQGIKNYKLSVMKILYYIHYNKKIFESLMEV